MKKVIFSVVLIGTILISGLVGYADQESHAGKQTELGSAVFSLNVLNK
ncbi:hypothetical protein SAMN04489762_3458 [Terribacillus saccharophilus]|uniref:Phr family secreted Rap phosphatase inhibitor n=1 Tax=Terribacillus saccharophilus TaxID=361277 RepID=A0AAX2EJW3_9BACI|nr:hypothetical protein SAMN04489762_3458 [Terribacillus saccharophilus]